MKETILQAKDLRFRYDPDAPGYALDGVSVGVRRGEFVAVLGGNGCGKSTLAKHFNAILLPETRTVTVEGETVELTFKEYALLHFFLEHPEEVLARERIMKAVWDTDDLLESRTIDMHVRTLRQKLGEAGESIRTVRKVGYKLSARGTEGTDET